MSFILVMYLLVIIYLSFIWFLVFKKTKNSSWLFFLVFTLSLGLWFLFYFLSYFSTESVNILYIYSKLTYSISIIWLYSFLLFLIYFWKKKDKLFNKNNLIVLFIFLGLLIFYNFTTLLIEWMYYDEIKKHHYEIPWLLYSFHNIASFLFIPLLIFFSFFKME